MNPDHLQQPVMTVVRKDAATLNADWTIEQALLAIRQGGLGEKIVYFYVVDENGCLAGVVPTRRLLTSPLEQRLTEVMARRVVAIPWTATILEVCEAFILHKFLAFPVVDEQRRIVGVVDVNVLTDEAFDLAEQQVTDEIFERIGFRIAQVRDASPAKAFRFRFPWLLATIGSGIICALLAGAYEVTLAKSLILAFFLTLVLGLGESVSIQSMTVAIQSLRQMPPSWGWYLHAFRREAGTAGLLGLACGAVVGVIAWLWRGPASAGAVIGLSILGSLCGACIVGLSIPTLLHALRLDPKIAAGPVTLALTDILTLLIYFTLAALAL